MKRVQIWDLKVGDKFAPYRGYDDKIDPAHEMIIKDKDDSRNLAYVESCWDKNFAIMLKYSTYVYTGYRYSKSNYDAIQLLAE